jgi:hypothetical protein
MSEAVADRADRLGYALAQWVMVRPHLYFSVAVPCVVHPSLWPYEIIRRRYGKTGWTYTVFRDGRELPLAFYSRKKDAEARIRQNAAGLDTVHIA